MSEKQATMTGREWRHFCSYWPFMVAGAVGPARMSAVEGDHEVTDDASNQAAGDAATAEGVADVESERYADGWGAVDHDDLAVAEEVVCALPGPNLASTAKYKQVFESLPIEDAVLNLFCEAAALNNVLFGDNMANTNRISPLDIKEMEEDADFLTVTFMQCLYGPLHTTKVHRLAHHLGEELRNRGNFSEGDTSTNEKLHGACKRMCRRSSKRGPRISLQMMRCEETQSHVPRELAEADAAELPVTENEEGVGDGGNESAMEKAADEVLGVLGRGKSAAIGDLKLLWGLDKLGKVLGLPDSDPVTMHQTARIDVSFSWDGPGRMQYVRATENFQKAPWFSFVWCKCMDNTKRWGQVRLVLSSTGILRRCCVVLQRMRQVQPRDQCVLTTYGCKRLAWSFGL